MRHDNFPIQTALNSPNFQSPAATLVFEPASVKRVSMAREPSGDEASRKTCLPLKRGSSLSGKADECFNNKTDRRVMEERRATRLEEKDFNFYFCNVSDVVHEIDEAQYVRDFIKARTIFDLKQKESILSSLLEAWKKKNAFIQDRLNDFASKFQPESSLQKIHDSMKEHAKDRKMTRAMENLRERLLAEKEQSREGQDFIGVTAKNAFCFDSGELPSVKFIFHTYDVRQQIERVVKGVSEAGSGFKSERPARQSTQKLLRRTIFEISSQRSFREGGEKEEAGGRNRQAAAALKSTLSNKRAKTFYNEEGFRAVPMVCFNNVMKKADILNSPHGVPPKLSKDCWFKTSPQGPSNKKSASMVLGLNSPTKREEEHILNYLKIKERRKDERPQLAGLGPLEGYLLKANKKLLSSYAKQIGLKMKK